MLLMLEALVVVRYNTMISHVTIFGSVLYPAMNEEAAPTARAVNRPRFSSNPSSSTLPVSDEACHRLICLI